MVRSRRGSPATTTVVPARPPEIVDAVNFLLAARDTGYRSTALSVAEFIDNALQASARRVSVSVRQGTDSTWPLELMIMDDGVGMDASALRRALTFGGSTRFDDRLSLGRYGMGLPNGALSRARRVEVYSWRDPTVFWTRLDLDEITLSRRKALARVAPVTELPFARRSRTGTVVRLLRCDRLEYKRPSWFTRRLEEELGRIYRYFLVDGLHLSVNGHQVRPVDPMFLEPSAIRSGACLFGDELVYRLPTDHGAGEIRVRFAELPIHKWHSLSSEEKREFGITNTPSVSVLRAKREIDRGWLFMGGKRRENYDDWWRCEIRFDPVLDELFGITHSKQAIVPTQELLQLLVPDLEPIARALNSRVRQRFELTKATAPLGAAERQARRADKSLPALPPGRYTIPEDLKDVVQAADQVLGTTTPYQIVVSELPTTAAFEVVVTRGRLLLLLNSRHPLYRDLYGPLASSESSRDQEVAKHVALAVLAAARADISTWRGSQRAQAQTFRQAWADVLATFMSA